eukprot:4827702-Lingulodinium_polyedra.AAC.1
MTHAGQCRQNEFGAGAGARGAGAGNAVKNGVARATTGAVNANAVATRALLTLAVYTSVQ